MNNQMDYYLYSFELQEYEDNLFLQCDKCRMMVGMLSLTSSLKMLNMELFT